MNRIVEERAAADPGYRARLKKKGSALLADARKLPDEDLVNRLARFDIRCDREWLTQASVMAFSAEEISMRFPNDLKTNTKEESMAENWIWFALTILWERWLPSHPSAEMLDDRMQEGYRILADGDSAAACECWLVAWSDFRNLFDRIGARSVEEFDRRFRGSQSIFNWYQDLEMELRNAGMNEKRIEYCREALDNPRLVKDDYIRASMRRAWAESLVYLGREEEGDALYETWLAENPQWGWGWIGWAGSYFLFASPERQRPEKAEEILRRALAIPDVEERNVIVKHFESVLKESGQMGKLRSPDMRKLLQFSPSKSSEAAGRSGFSAGSPVPADADWPNVVPETARGKIGRNEPCPCGSGKKYKRCCGA